MFGKILLTLAVILGAYAVARARARPPLRRAPRPSDGRPFPAPPGPLRALAYGLVLVMVTGSLWWLYRDWEQGREIIQVQVINVHTGQVALYRARRADIQTRQFLTIEGHRVTLADIERMVEQ